MGPVLLLSLAIILSLPQPVNADDAPRNYSCRPALSVFCRNIHVGCAGATNIPTASFKISIIEAVAQVDFEGAEPSMTGRVAGSGDLVIRLENGWIRIPQDGRYSYRIYRDGSAAMSYGTCRRTPVQ